MIKVGDRVKFISDTGVGIVRSIKNGVAQVEVDGFEIPALVTDIVAVDAKEEAAAIVKIGPDSPSRHSSSSPKKQLAAASYGKVTIDDQWEDEPIDILAIKRQYAAQLKSQTADAEAAPKPVAKPPYQEKDYAAKLLFVPTSAERLPEESDLDLYLVNDSTYDVFYSVGLWERNNFVSTLNCGKLEADTKLKIHHFPRKTLANIMKLHVSLLPCKPVNYTVQPVTQVDLELHPLKFVRPHSYTENDYFDERSVEFTLFDSNAKNRE